MKICVGDRRLELADLRAAWMNPVTVSISDNARARVAASNRLIDETVAGGEQVYGVNTGFGRLAQVRISKDELVRLQENLVRSHSVGVGEDLDDRVVRLIMLTKVAALAEGYSGVRPELIDTLCALINQNVYPRIPARGSVGASGDLAPLAHMASVLIGAGEARLAGTVVLTDS